MKATGTTLATAAAALLLAGCASAHAFRIDGAPDYPPVPPDSVAVYESAEELPCDDVERLARLEGTGDQWASRDDVVGKMRERAARVGADAVLLAGFSDTSFGAWFSSGKDARAEGVAVRLRCGRSDPGG